jgi:hypothetical protein
MTTTTKRSAAKRSTSKKPVQVPQTTPADQDKILKEEELKPADAARECGLHKDTLLKMTKDPVRWPWPVIRRSKRGPGSLGIPRSSVEAYKRSLVKVGGAR